MSTEFDVARSSPPGGPTYTGWQAALAHYFKFDFYKTNFKTEILTEILDSITTLPSLMCDG